MRAFDWNDQKFKYLKPLKGSFEITFDFKSTYIHFVPTNVMKYFWQFPIQPSVSSYDVQHGDLEKVVLYFRPQLGSSENKLASPSNTPTGSTTPLPAWPPSFTFWEIWHSHTLVDCHPLLLLHRHKHECTPPPHARDFTTRSYPQPTWDSINDFSSTRQAVYWALLAQLNYVGKLWLWNSKSTSWRI